MARTKKQNYDGDEVAEGKETTREAVEVAKPPHPLDSPDLQAEIMAGKEPYIIHLLDGSEVPLRLNHTVADVRKSRIDGKIQALRMMLMSEASGFESAYQEFSKINPQIAYGLAFKSAIQCTDKAQDLILQIAAKLAGVDVSKFNDNISGNDLADLGLTILTFVGVNPEIANAIFGNVGASQAKN